MDMFSALSDPNRRKIVELIARNGHLSATDISNNFNISAPAISQHLKILRETKLVDMEKRAQQRIYTINTTSLHEIETWISKINKVWNEKFDRLSSVLEELKRKEDK
jgi:DNA-binding transcriptional ArsR family regulator